jgi:hypothetical protein
MKGYWNRPDETEKVMRGGWFLTGDIGVMDEDGYFRIVDRKKDMVVVSGFNVYPNEIEDCLATHPGILESAVIGVPDAATGEAVKAFVVARDKGLTAGRHPRPLQGAPDRLQGAQIVEFRDDLPKSNVGKILRKDLRAEEMRSASGGGVGDGRSLRTGASRRHDLRHHAGHGRVAHPARFLAGAQTPLRPDDRRGVAIRVHALHRLPHGDHADLPEPIAIGLLIVSCMPGGTTSNIFTYFSKGNLALSVLMTVTSTVFGVLLIPIVLLVYASALDLEIPRENIIATLVILLVPVAIGMGLRKFNANVGAVTEFMGSALALFFIAFIAISWVPRNWQFLLTPRPPPISPPSCWACSASPSATPSRAILRLHPRNARTVALETGIQNGPLAIAIIALTFAGEEQQASSRWARSIRCSSCSS